MFVKYDANVLVVDENILYKSNLYFPISAQIHLRALWDTVEKLLSAVSLRYMYGIEFWMFAWYVIDCKLKMSWELE